MRSVFAICLFLFARTAFSRAIAAASPEPFSDPAGAVVASATRSHKVEPETSTRRPVPRPAILSRARCHPDSRSAAASSLLPRTRQIFESRM